MPEIGSSGLMSGDGKRGVGHRPQATAPILDSTNSDIGQLLNDYVRRALTLTQINSSISTSIYFSVPTLSLESIHARFSPSPDLIP